MNMCDSEVHFNKPDYAQSDKMLMEDQRIRSLSLLAFWSNPAWFRSTKHSLLPATAIKEWVAYQRLTVATNKETIAEIIGSVRKVIPDSKLSKYGDFSYNVDYEDMYCIHEDFNHKSHSLKANKLVYARRYDVWASDPEANITDTREKYDLDLNNKKDIADVYCRVRSLSKWLKELNRVLMEVKKIASEAQLMDSRTETLFKFCLRFVCILKNNENLVKLLNSDISFIVDYEKLRERPISKVELLSIPQPENIGDIFLNNENVDALWLNLCSSRIRNIWKKDMRFPFPFDSDKERNRHLVPLMKINFLRNQQSKSLHSLEKSTDILIDIPKNMEIELLGSLLNVINEGTLQPGYMLTKLDAVAGSYFPEAHGAWTKNLFPHRRNLPQINKDSVPWKACRTAPILHAKVAKLEDERTETNLLSIQYYKSVPPPKLPVPPPTLAARFRIPLLNPQPRNKLMFMRPNDLGSNPPNQQVQYKYPSVPVSCVPPAVYTSQVSFSQNNSAPQRFPTPEHAGVTVQYQRLNFFRPPYQSINLQGTKELQKHSSKIEESSCLKQISVEKKDNNLNDENHVHNNSETKDINIPEITNAPFVQVSSGYNVPFRIQQNVENAITNTNKTLQSSISNSKLRMYESTNHPVTSIRCRPPLIKNMPSPRNHYMLPRFISKPRFLGPITINSLKRMQERIFQQRHQNEPLKQKIQKSASIESISSNFHDRRLDCDDKVEKWLESVNKYVKPGSYINLEELPELPNVESLELSNIELPEHPTVQHHEPSTIKLPDYHRIEVPEFSKIELPKYHRNESNRLSELSEYPKTELPAIYNKLHGSEKGDCKGLGKQEDENASDIPQEKLSQDQIISLFSTSSKTVEKEYENKASYLKIKKLKAKKVFLEHLRQFQDATQELKSCKNIRKKIKIVKRYFAGINSGISRRFRLENFIKAMGKKKHKSEQLKKNVFSSSKQQCHFRKKFYKQLPKQINLDMQKSNLLINDISKYNILIRESQEFNTFPSKRIKLNKSQFSFFKTETFIRDQRDQWLASLNYFDAIIDELFFAANGIEEISTGNRMKRMNVEVNGWTHFKVAVKTVMKSLISSLKAQNL